MSSLPRILFVDDEIQVLNGLRRALRGCEKSWDMVFVVSPHEALASCRMAPYDVVVSDMRMPGMNGIELVVAMRRFMPDASYIMLTGTADLRIAIDSINQAKVFRFFTKPCPSFLLKEGIAAALAARRSGEVSAPVGFPQAPPQPFPQPPSPALPAGFVEMAGQAALDRLSLAVIVLNGGARVTYMNKRSGDLCATEDGLVIGPDKVCRAALPAETPRLHDLIRRAATAGDHGVFSLSRRSMKRPLSVVISPLPVLDCRTAMDDGVNVVALYISDPEEVYLPSPEQLGVLLNLPPAKAKLTHSLALGYSLDEAAVLCGVTTGTARTYLKEIFSRTGTSRQAELVKLAFSQPVLDD